MLVILFYVEVGCGEMNDVVVGIGDDRNGELMGSKVYVDL